MIKSIAEIRAKGLLRRLAFGGLLAMALCFSCLSLNPLTLSVSAEEGKDKAEHKKVRPVSATKQVQGEISWMNSKYIAVVYNRDLERGVEEEILLPFDKDLQLEHRKSLKELKVGDTVRIQYQEDAEVDEQGNQGNQARKAKVVSFIKAAANKAPLSSSDGASGQKQFEIKGAKETGSNE